MGKEHSMSFTDEATNEKSEEFRKKKDLTDKQKE